MAEFLYKELTYAIPSAGSGQVLAPPWKCTVFSALGFWSLSTKKPWPDGDKETRGWGDREQGEVSPCHLVTPSPVTLWP